MDEQKINSQRNHQVDDIFVEDEQEFTPVEQESISAEPSIEGNVDTQKKSEKTDVSLDEENVISSIDSEFPEDKQEPESKKMTVVPVVIPDIDIELGLSKSNGAEQVDKAVSSSPDGSGKEDSQSKNEVLFDVGVGLSSIKTSSMNTNTTVPSDSVVTSSHMDKQQKKKKKKPLWIRILLVLSVCLLVIAIAVVVVIGYFTRNLTIDHTSHSDSDLGIGTAVEWNESMAEMSSEPLDESSIIVEVSSVVEVNSSVEEKKEIVKHRPSRQIKDRNEEGAEESVEESSEEESQIEESSEESSQETPGDDVSYVPVQTVSRDGVINIALFGLSAEYAFDTLRSDSIIVLTLDTNHWMIKLTSILRDSKVPIEGYRAQKINAAYRYGGPWLAVKTINQNFGLDIRNYITVDLGQMEAIINAMGGIHLYITPGEAEIIGSGSGDVWLNGWQAVMYCRIRAIGTDTERANRQRKVLNYIFYRFKDMGVSEKLSFAQQLLSYVSTSLSWGEITNLLSLPLGSYGIATNSVPIQGVDYGVWGGIDSYGEWVWVYDIPSAARRIQNFIYG